MKKPRKIFTFIMDNLFSKEVSIRMKKLRDQIKHRWKDLFGLKQRVPML